MKDKEQYQVGKKVFDIEIEALKKVRESLDSNFNSIVNAITSCEGKVIITGMGKPGHIGEKIAATFSSLGIPSFFVHPAEAQHGDLGMIQKKDVVIAISYSGESTEVTGILMNLKRIGALIIGITGNKNSTLALHSDLKFIFPDFEEACSLKLAPTSSTTSVLVLGDALAIAASEKNNFKVSDYALYHPAGSLGKKLLLTTFDLMHKNENNSMVYSGSSLNEVILEMSSKSLGVVAICNTKNELLGIFTDGDLRRVLSKEIDIFKTVIDDIMTVKPTTCFANTLAIDALKIMNDNHVTSLIVKSQKNQLEGIILMIDIVKSGLSI